MTTGRLLISFLAFLALAGPAAAEKEFPFDEAAKQIVDWSYADCRPDKIPPAVKSKTSSPGASWFWFRSSPEEVADVESRASLRPSILNRGFDDGTSLSDAAQQLIIHQIEQSLSRVKSEDGRGVNVRNLAEWSKSAEYIGANIGGDRGEELAAAMAKAKFDFVLSARVSRDAGGAVVRVHFVLDTPTGSCLQRTSDVILPPGFGQDVGEPEEIIGRAVGELFKQAGTPVKRVAILPLTKASQVLPDSAGAALSQMLADEILKAAAPTSSTMGSSTSSEPRLRIVQLSKGEFFGSAVKPGDWLAQMRLLTEHDGVKLVIDLFDLGGAIALQRIEGRIAAKYMPKEDADLVAAFVEDQLKLRTGKDGLQFHLRFHRTGLPFCLTQEADGETIALFPNVKLQRPLVGSLMLQPRASAISYPKDLVSELSAAPMGKASVFYMRCIFVREDHQIEAALAAWMPMTPGKRATASRPLHLDGSEFVKLWSNLRKMTGSSEILSVVHVTAGQ